MNAAPNPTPIRAPAKPRRWRWLRFCAFVISAASVIIGGLYVYSDVSTRLAMHEAEAEAAKDMPRWRLAEMEADRRQIPDVENSALHIISIPYPKKNVRFLDVPNYEVNFRKLPANVEMNAQQLALIQDVMSKIVKPLEKARGLKGMPYGRFPITYSNDYFGTQIPEQIKSCELGEWLAHDALLRVHEGDADGAVDSCRAIVNVGRAVADEPMLISFLIRMRMQVHAFSSLERILAQGEPVAEALKELQTLLELELAECNWRHALRGERAGHQHLYENIRAGKASPLTLDFRFYRTDHVTEWIDNAIPNRLLKYYPEHLRNLNRAIEIGKLPRHERTAKLQELDDKVGASKNPIGSIWPAATKTHHADCRSQVYLGAAVAALACERYRIKHHNWPPALDALVKQGLLASVPVDPRDGKALRYRRTKEGIVIYSIGTDAKDDDGNVDCEGFNQMFDIKKGSLANLTWPADLGIRIWNVNLRRQPPQPPVVIADPPKAAPGPGPGPGVQRSPIAINVP